MCSVTSGKIDERHVASRFFQKQHQVVLPDSSSMDTDSGFSRQYLHCGYSSGLDDATRLAESPVFVFIHGGGFTSMSWAKAAKCCFTAGLPVLVVDLFGHGSSCYAHGAGVEEDFSIKRYKKDMVEIINTILSKDHLGLEEAPRIVLVGHSMGGAVATHVAAVDPDQLCCTVCGLVVVDVVEGTAIEALAGMEGVLERMPVDFGSEEEAIMWIIGTYMRQPTVDSGKFSVPSMLSINERTKRYEWRTNLRKTIPYWREWYEGMSALFLGSSIKKMLVVAGMDRLDTPLTIGHMQGKFQYVNLPTFGHLVHEEDPELFSRLLVEFAVKHGLKKSSMDAVRAKLSVAWK
jgi:pimeloyl-ACP methyl ester carboxylesterase